MWVTNAKLSVLSIITGGGKWVEMGLAADPPYQHLLLTAEKRFWRWRLAILHAALGTKYSATLRVKFEMVDGAPDNLAQTRLMTSARRFRH